MTLVLRDAIVIACVGCCDGLDGSLVHHQPAVDVSRAGLERTDPMTFVGTTVLLLLVSLPPRGARRAAPCGSIR